MNTLSLTEEDLERIVGKALREEYHSIFSKSQTIEAAFDIDGKESQIDGASAFAALTNWLEERYENHFPSPESDVCT